MMRINVEIYENLNIKNRIKYKKVSQKDEQLTMTLKLTFKEQRMNALL